MNLEDDDNVQEEFSKFDWASCPPEYWATVSRSVNETKINS